MPLRICHDSCVLNGWDSEVPSPISWKKQGGGGGEEWGQVPVPHALCCIIDTEAPKGNFKKDAMKLLPF